MAINESLCLTSKSFLCDNDDDGEINLSKIVLFFFKSFNAVADSGICL
jgi:hypothetical protein